MQYDSILALIIPVPCLQALTFWQAGRAVGYSIYLDNRALDNSSFLLIVQNLVSPEWNGLSHSKIVLVNRSRYSG